VTEQEKAELFAGKAPPLNQAERDAINALFPAYIFRRSRTDEIWTTCCRKHMVVQDEDMMVTTPERNFPAVMWEPHQREQRNRWDDAPKPTVQCPLCGRMVIVKELRYTGGRDNLSRYRRAVVLRWYRGGAVDQGLRLRQALQQRQRVQPHRRAQHQVGGCVPVQAWAGGGNDSVLVGLSLQFD